MAIFTRLRRMAVLLFARKQMRFSGAGARAAKKARVTYFARVISTSVPRFRPLFLV